jgi:hypothetical protein
MAETTPPPSQPFTAVLNAGQTAVNLNWGLPVDDMVLIYDDGIQDNFAIWATGAGLNKNAMKFTPISYPTIVKGFYFNIGTAANYAIGSNPLAPVQMAIYSEVGGLPGVQLSAPTTTNATGYGWNKSNFTIPVTIVSGNFFIVMIQLGNSTASPGIAIDTTIQQLRSYSKFGSTPWIPGPGNFMMRAIVNGSGGPLLMGDQSSGTPITASAVPGLIYQYAPATITGVEGSPKVYPEMGYNPDNLLGYQVWRRLQGQANPLLWISVGTTTNTNIVDNSWPSLPCGPYQWAAEAQYTFNRWSVATFSSVIGKCWTCNVTVNVDLSCDTANALGAVVKFQNTDVVDTSYTYVMTASGTHTFTNFWKGNYTLTVTKFDYTIFSQTYSILGDMTINVMLMQIKTPPTYLHVYDSTLLATWKPPLYEQVLFNEDFTGGFGPNSWVADAGGHWTVAAAGNPGNCAYWPYAPEVFNYNDNLTSKVLTGVNSSILKLSYDVYLYNYGNTTLEQLAVEVYDGTIWHMVKNYDNSSGASMPWTTATFDITSIAPSSGFKIRFRAYGVDSYNIYNWNIDNVKIVAQTAPHDPCIIGYNFYLNNVINGFTPDTFYNIPPATVQYGTLYHACVLAVYGSGYSIFAPNPNGGCVDFTSKFLCPPSSLTGVAIECTAYLSWAKPNCGGCTLAQYLSDDNSGETGWDINAGALAWLGNKFPLGATQAGVIKSFDLSFVASGSTNQQLTIDVFSGAQILIASSAPFTATAGAWINVPVSDIPYTGTFYGMVKWNNVPGTSHYLNQDENGPQHNLALGYYMDLPNGWMTMGAATGYPEGSFLLRANVCQSDKKSDAVVVEEKTPEPKTGPIANLLASHVEYPSFTPAPLVTPDAPDAAPTLLGYHVYRNGVNVSPLLSPTTLEYYDYNLNPGTYSYTVNAWYNVSPIPPLVDNSQPAGPVSVTLNCGYPLPFFEPWTLGSFNYQSWSFAPSQGNWFMNTAVGDPTPCADFSWQPVITNYDLSLVTPTIDATAWTCADIFCDFDVKLIDHNATGTEKLDIDVFVGGIWQNKAVLSDSGSYDWTLKHVNISSVMGKGFKLRFRAHGPNSANILHWYVDNIHIYGVCRPPTSLAGYQNQFTTTLTWHSPVCPTLCNLKQYMYDDGTAENGYTNNTAGTYQLGNFYPIGAGTSGVIKSIDLYFSFNGNSSPQSCIIYFYKADQTTIIGQSPSFIQSGASWPAGAWINVPCADILYSGPFYAMVDYSGYTALPMKNFLDCDNQVVQPGFPNGLAYLNNNGTWGPAGPAYSNPIATFIERANVCENGKDKDAPVTTIDPSQMPPITVMLPQANAPSLGTITGNSNVIVAPPAPVITPNAPAGSQSLGYNIYRTKDDSINGSFIKVNPSYWGDTTYTEVHGPATQGPLSWKYYVTVVFQDSLTPGHILCEPSSDTILINFPTVGINDPTNNSISLYPNPANDVVYIVSTNDIKTIEVLNYIGQTIYTNNNVNLKKAQLNVISFKSGVYFVKITTTSGIKTTKITVTH